AESREPLVVELAEDTNNGARRAVIQGKYKAIFWDGGVKKALYDLEKDPGEEHDLSKQEPAKLAELEAAAKVRFDALPVVAPFGGNKLKSGKSANGPKGPPSAGK
ncbi:MAG TPA: hypothetical protein VLC09_16010, partial [Polyangiaceae bacterium]|nr:hypothetical protein [Polyangiaceae bacterium]